MIYLSWSKDYSVNVKEIDEQHKKLFGIINTLYQAMLDEKGREIQKSVIAEMIDYANTHFKTEEKYMLQFDFSWYEEHKKEHERFIHKALDLKERSEKVGFVITLEILNFLKDWLQGHVLQTDRNYSELFNDKGLH
ncbi:MAG TPA: bacteriohemerythrin [Nitrospiria bacterium]|nr:bacteriohemerythrin [Nitrospiria bacterium]